MKQVEKLAIIFVRLFIFTVCGAVQIDNCNNNAINIVDDTRNPTGIICSGLTSNQNVGWVINKGGQITTVATCNGTGCTISVSYVSAVRSSGTSTLTFVQQITQNADGAIVHCTTESVSANCVINVIGGKPNYYYEIEKCQKDGVIELAKNSDTVVSCTGVKEEHDMYWTVAYRSGTSRRIDCTPCYSPPCIQCTGTYRGLQAVRKPTSSQLTVTDRDGDMMGVNIRCSHSNNSTQDQCPVTVITPYIFDNVKNGTLHVTENSGRAITCYGITASQNMFWTVRYKSGTVNTAHCSSDVGSSSTQNNCTSDDSGMLAFRYPDSSFIAIRDDKGSLDGAVVTCSKLDEVTQAVCQVKVISHALPDCEDDVIVVSKESEVTNVRCQGIGISDIMHWSVTWPNGTQAVVANCASCGQQGQFCPCVSLHQHFQAARDKTTSFVTIDADISTYYGVTVTCSRQDKGKSASCSIEGPTIGMLQDPESQTAALAAGVTVAAVVVVIIIIVVVIVVFQKRQSRSKSRGSGENVATYTTPPPHASANRSINNVRQNDETATSDQPRNNYDQLSNYLVAGDDIRQYEVINNPSANK